MNIDTTSILLGIGVSTIFLYDRVKEIYDTNENLKNKVKSTVKAIKDLTGISYLQRIDGQNEFEYFNNTKTLNVKFSDYNQQQIMFNHDQDYMRVGSMDLQRTE